MIITHITSNFSYYLEMTNFYLDLCEQFQWDADKNLVDRLKSRNKKHLEELNAKIVDAEENLGESEVRESLLAKANYYNQIGDKVCYSKNH